MKWLHLCNQHTWTKFDDMDYFYGSDNMDVIGHCE